MLATTQPVLRASSQTMRRDTRICYVDFVVDTVVETNKLDELREKEYPALATHTYLDFTAAGLYSTSQIARHFEFLKRQLCGNPHSTNPSSSLATECVERARRAI